MLSICFLFLQATSTFVHNFWSKNYALTLSNIYQMFDGFIDEFCLAFFFNTLFFKHVRTLQSITKNFECNVTALSLGAKSLLEVLDPNKFRGHTSSAVFARETHRFFRERFSRWKIERKYLMSRNLSFAMIFYKFQKSMKHIIVPLSVAA